MDAAGAGTDLAIEAAHIAEGCLALLFASEVFALSLTAGQTLNGWHHYPSACSLALGYLLLCLDGHDSQAERNTTVLTELALANFTRPVCGGHN